MRSCVTLAIAAASLGMALPVSAQSVPSTTPVVNASLRLRAEAWDWFDTPVADGSYTYGAALARLALSQQRPALGWRVEVAAPLLIGLPDDAAAPAPAGQLGLGAAYYAANDNEQNVAGLFLKQAFVRLGRAPGRNGWSLRLGRFEFIDGSEVTPGDATVAALRRERIAHRLLGNFGFSHVQRSLDGIHYALDNRRLNMTGAVFFPNRGVFDVKGWDDLDINVQYLSFNGRSRARGQRFDWRLFAVRYDDQRGLKVDNRSVAARQADGGDITLLSYGGHYLRAFDIASATADILLWAVLQTGDWGSLDQKSHAFALEAGLQPAMASLKPWLRAGINRSSGDTDAADAEHGTFFQLLPTPRPYARFPFYNMMNVQDVFGSLLLRPAPKVSLKSEVHALQLTERADLWYAGGGAFEKQTFGYSGRPSGGLRELATLIDASLDLRVRADLTVSGYVGFARGGNVISNSYPGGDNATLGYLELEWRH